MAFFKQAENKKGQFYNYHSTGLTSCLTGHGHQGAGGFMKHIMGQKRTENIKPGYMRLDSTGQVASDEEFNQIGVTVMPEGSNTLSLEEARRDPDSDFGTGFFHYQSGETHTSWINNLVSKALPWPKSRTQSFCASMASPQNYSDNLHFNGLQQLFRTESDFQEMFANKNGNNKIPPMNKSSKPLNPNAAPWYPPNFFCYKQGFQGPVAKRLSTEDILAKCDVKDTNSDKTKEEPSHPYSSEYSNSVTQNNSCRLQHTMTAHTTCDNQILSVPTETPTNTDTEFHFKMKDMSISESIHVKSDSVNVPCCENILMSVRSLQSKSPQEKPLFLLASIESKVTATDCMPSEPRFSTSPSSISADLKTPDSTLESVECTDSFVNIDPAVIDLFENMSSSPQNAFEKSSDSSATPQHFQFKMSSTPYNDGPSCDDQSTAKFVLTNKLDSAKKKNRPSAKRRRRNKQKCGNLQDSTETRVKKGKVSIYVQPHSCSISLDQPNSPLFGSSPVSGGACNHGIKPTLSSPEFALGFLIQAHEINTSDSDDSGWDDDSDSDPCKLASGDISWDAIPTGGLSLTDGFDFHFTYQMNNNVSEKAAESWSKAEEDHSNSMCERVHEANQKWSQAYEDVAVKATSSKIQFKGEDELTSIFLDAQDPNLSSDYAEARKGPWEEYARDRARFFNRIQESEKVISPCLTKQHRQTICQRLLDKSS